jgi:hypothetical protein
MRTPVMGPAQVYRLGATDPQTLGRYTRHVFGPKSEAERTLASQRRRFPDAILWIEAADTLDATGHVLPPERRTWRRCSA